MAPSTGSTDSLEVYNASSMANSTRSMCNTVSATATLRITVAAASGKCGTAKIPACTTSDGTTCASRRSTVRPNNTCTQRACAPVCQALTTRVSTQPASRRALRASVDSSARPKAVCAQGSSSDNREKLTRSSSLKTRGDLTTRPQNHGPAALASNGARQSRAQFYAIKNDSHLC